MRVLLAPDGFTGTLTAPRAAQAMADGWLAARPGDDVDVCPLSDGGPDFLAVLSAAVGGRLVDVAATGPDGRALSAPHLLADDGTAYVESALACGAPPAGPRSPLTATTAGVGQLLAAAMAGGARRVVVGLGGSVTTDAGAGALAALGAGEDAVLGRGGGALAAVGPADLADLARTRDRWAGTDLVVASDVDVPLLGPHGAARGFGPQKGAAPEQVEVLERALAAFAAAAALALPGVDVEALAAAPGAGAAGGLGFGLALLGARRVGGGEAVADAVGLRVRVEAVAASGGVVLTGEGRLDWQSLRGKVVARVAAAGRAAGARVHAVAGQVDLPAGAAGAAGLAGAHAVAHTPDEVTASMADPAGALAARVRSLAEQLTGPRS